MAFCKNCGTRMEDHAAFCPICGTAVQNNPEDESAGFGWTCLSFCFPFIGFILWLAWKNNQPGKAQSVCTAAWIGFAISMVLNLVSMLLGMV